MKTNWRKGLRKDKRTKNLLRWEESQAKGYFKEGVAVGLILGSGGVGIIYFLLLYFLS